MFGSGNTCGLAAAPGKSQQGHRDACQPWLQLQRDLRKSDTADGRHERRLMVGRRDKRPMRRRYSSMGGPTMPDPNGSTTLDSSSSDKPTSFGQSSSTPPGEKKVDMRTGAFERFLHA